MAEATRYEQRVYRIMHSMMQRSLRKNISKFLRSGCVVSAPSGPGVVDALLPELATLVGSTDQRSRAKTKVAQIIRSSVRQTLSNSLSVPWMVQERVADEVVSQLMGRASILDLELRMPPIRKEPAQRAARPLSLRQRRARDATLKLKAWSRRMATAKTKVAMYRKKVTYYAKKGVI